MSIARLSIPLHILGTLFVLLSAPRLQAQRPDVRAVAAELRGARDGRVLVNLHGETIDGGVVRVRGDSVTLVQGTATRTVPIAAIDALWVREISTRQGVISGAILVGLLGGAAGIYVGGMCDYATGCSREVVKAGIGGVVIGGAIGALLGGAIGRHATHWVQVVR